MTSISYAFEVLIGYVVFGLLIGLLGSIITAFEPYSQVNAVKDLAGYIWSGSVVIYLIFGAFYFWRQIRIWNIMRQQ